MAAELTAADPAAEELRRRLARTASDARRALGLPDDGGLPDAGDLRRLIEALEQRVEADGEPGGWREATAADADELERLHKRYQARFDALQRIGEALERLREITSPAEMLARAPRELCESSHLSRSVLSLIRAGRLVAEAAYFRDDPAAAARALEELGASAPRLEHPLIETEILRRRRATIVHDARAHPRVHQPTAQIMGWGSYVAAPLAVRGEVIGLLHADAAGTGYSLDVLDGDVLWAFARGLADFYETASLRRSLRRQRDEMRQFVEWLSAESIELSNAAIDLAPSQTATSAPPGEPNPAAGVPGLDDRAVFEDLLTRRELDVLRLLSRGATNAGIAAELVISEATVKSHVAGVLRKLRVRNRAEAVARYHRLMSLRGS